MFKRYYAMHRGTSLIELIIVIAILAILASLAIPSTRIFYSHSTLKSDVQSLACILEEARLNSMKQGIRWKVVFNPGERMYLAFGDSDGDGSIGRGEEIKGPFYLYKGVIFGSGIGQGPNGTSIPLDGVSFNANRVSFSPMGSCNAGTVYLSLDGMTYAIRILPATGDVQLWVHRSGWEMED